MPRYVIERDIPEIGSAERDALRAEGVNDSDGKINSLREFAIECAIIKVAGSELVSYYTQKKSYEDRIEAIEGIQAEYLS